MLSQGEQQRIGFARALLIRPDFLFLDEATSAMDTTLTRYFYELLKERCPQTCLISVGHNMDLREWHATEWPCMTYSAR